jgi:hypothetical protein
MPKFLAAAPIDRIIVRIDDQSLAPENHYSQGRFHTGKSNVLGVVSKLAVDKTLGYQHLSFSAC